MDYLIQIKNVSAGYKENKVLKDVSLNIMPNDFIGIIGPNGGGKSTLLKLILGEVKYYSGEIKYKWTDDFRLHIGYLPQHTNINTNFPISVIEVVMSGMLGAKNMFGRYTKADKNKALELLEFTGLKDMANRAINKLSGGQMQRVYLCRAIINNPELLILDEPNTYMDKKFERELYKLLKELNKEMAVVLVSHDIGTISSYVKTIACVNEQLHYHNSNVIDSDIMKVYNCPIELISHGTVPHRVLKNH